ncbi:MAG: AAA family ATPase, partial [Ilumatobacteraceae bacterium]|nr:AAA family ATPase [Ilumatobacteraceae bacterium]
MSGGEGVRMAAQLVITAKTRVPNQPAIDRPRLDAVLARVVEHPLTLVVAPAGSGKSTALASYARRSAHTVVWYRTDAGDGSAEAFLAHLRHGIAAATGRELSEWSTADDALADLERDASADPLVVIVDDLHTVRDRPAEDALARLVEYLPEHVHLVVGTRSHPTFDLTRLRLEGRLLEIGADDLRFRTWESEQLLADLYGMDLGPEDVARLTRRVEGWAAGLQLYHLAVRTRPPREQRRLIDVASSRSSLARQYLTRNVLDGLRPELADFLLDTSVLGVVSGPMADELLGRADSAALLGELVELQLFVTPLDHELHRYHEVLRSLLESLLGEAIGPDALRERFAVASAILERSGHLGEALRCSARAERWDDVRRLVGMGDSDPLTQSYAWLDLLPPSIADDDAWLVLARARAELAAGRLHVALDRLRRAEALFGDAPGAEQARATRRRIEHLVDGSADDVPGWTGTWRRGLRSDPRSAITRLLHDGSPEALLGAAMLQLAIGEPGDAGNTFDRALRCDPVPTWVEVGGAIGRALVRR